jgi:hypothetical protein
VKKSSLAMRTSRLRKWLERIYATQNVEISCSDCFNTIAVYIERELAGETEEWLFPFGLDPID